MKKYIYKYLGPNLASIALGDEGVTLKCSMPQDFNDPYELFLTVDYKSDAEALACYQDAIGTIPQLPTTCFSVSPAVSPMWAHYGANVSGFAIEFDEGKMREEFPESLLEDVSYQDVASRGLTEMLFRAHVIGKPRYTYLLRQGVFNAAYFTKSSAWSYEMERRMLAGRGYVRTENEILLLDVPKHCVSGIIAGARSSPDLIETLIEKAESYGCDFFQMKIGRTNIKPYFVDAEDETYIFDGSQIAPADFSCESCHEPLDKESTQCSWCQITDNHREEAALRNPYRIMDRFGLLENYIETMNGVTKRNSQTED